MGKKIAAAFLFFVILAGMLCGFALWIDARLSYSDSLLFDSLDNIGARLNDLSSVGNSIAGTAAGIKGDVLGYENGITFILDKYQAIIDSAGGGFGGGSLEN